MATDNFMTDEEFEDFLKKLTEYRDNLVDDVTDTMITGAWMLFKTKERPSKELTANLITVMAIHQMFPTEDVCKS